MSFAGGLGMAIKLSPLTMPAGQEPLSAEKLLFSESNTRFIVEVSDDNKFAKAMKGVPVWKIGRVSKDTAFRIYSPDGKLIISSEINRLKAAWQSPFRDM